MASDEVSRDDLEAAFREDVKYGMEVLHTFFQTEIAGYIKCVGHSALDASDIADIYQDVMLEMIEVTRKPSFNPKEPMRLVYRVAHTNTKDFLRRRGYRATFNLDECLEHLANDLKDTDVELKWKYLTPEQQKNFYLVLFDIVSDLPKMQQITANVYITRYKDVRDGDVFTAVAEGVREITGENITVAATKRNWYEALKKIALELKRRDIDLYSSE